MSSTSVVIPVRDGERFLEELLESVLSQSPQEVLVIDSGSRDRSLEIARRAKGVGVVQIAPAQFGHGRTRNLGAQKTSGELIAFLTQDAVPVTGWLDAYREAFSANAGLGAAYGPHLPRPETSPMVARELIAFFAAMAPTGEPCVQGPDAMPFLSNVNACYSRKCWAAVRFPDLPYAEDQAFAAAMLEAGWLKAYLPDAGVLHAHDYGAVGFARRYFDEYRGLRTAIGYVEPIDVRTTVWDIASRVKGDNRWMRERGWPVRKRAPWALRSAAHHTSRRVFAAVGSRAERLPSSVQRRLSLEGTAPQRPTVHSAPPRGADGA